MPLFAKSNSLASVPLPTVTFPFAIFEPVNVVNFVPTPLTIKVLAPLPTVVTLAWFVASPFCIINVPAVFVGLPKVTLPFVMAFLADVRGFVLFETVRVAPLDMFKSPLVCVKFVTAPLVRLYVPEFTTFVAVPPDWL